MPLKGDLGSIDLAHVFQMLSLNQKAGTLEIFASGVRTCLHFVPHGVIFPYHEPQFVDKVVARLVRRLRLSEKHLSDARREATRSGADLLTCLVELDIVPRDERHSAFREQMEEEIYELFFSTDASFEFREGEPLPVELATDESFILPANSLIMEAARRIDEWGYIRGLIGDDGDIFEVVGVLTDVPKEERDSALAEVLKAVDGIRTIASLVDITKLTRYVVSKKLALLVEQGVIAPVASDVLIERAQKCLQGERVRDAICLFEKAIQSGMRDPVVYEMTGLAYQSVGEPRKAAMQYRAVAQTFHEMSDMAAEAEVHLRIRELVPIEIESRMRLLEIHHQDPALMKNYEFDALKEASEVSMILRELSRTESAIKIVRDLVDQYEEDIDGSLQIADLAIELGDPRTAVETLFQAAERLHSQNKSDAALRIYRRVKAIDPGHVGAGERLRASMMAKGQYRKARKRRMRMAITAIVLSMIGVTYLEYSRRSWFAYRAITTSDYVGKADFDGARDAYRRLRASYPGTLWAFLCSERMADVDLAEQSYHALHKERQAIEEQAEVNRQSDAIAVLKEARDLLVQGDVEQALDLFKRADSIATDRKWKREERLPDAIADLQRYLERAKRLYAEGVRHSEKKAWNLAHGSFSKLVKDYPNAPQVHDLEIPVRVQTHPDGARVEVDGVELTAQRALGVQDTSEAVTTPCAMALIPSVPHTVRVSLEGYEPYEEEFLPEERSLIRASLRKLAERTVQWENAKVVAVFGRDGVLVQVDEESNIRTVDVAEEVVRWEQPLLGISEVSRVVIGAPDLVLAGPSSTLVCVDIDTGEERWRKQFEAPLGSVLSRVGSMWLAGLGESLVGLDAQGEAVLEAELGSAVTVNPVDDRGRAVLGLEDGRVITISPRDATVVWERSIGSPIRGLLESGEGRLVTYGDEKRMYCLDTADGEVLWSAAFPPGELQTVVASPKAIYALVDSRLHVIDWKNGQSARSAYTGEGLALDAYSETLLILADTEEVKVLSDGFEKETLYLLPEAPNKDAVVTGGFFFVGCGSDLYCGVSSR